MIYKFVSSHTALKYQGMQQTWCQKEIGINTSTQKMYVNLGTLNNRNCHTCEIPNTEAGCMLLHNQIITKSTIMKSSLLDTMEQLDRRESQRGVTLPFPSSSTSAPPPVSTGGSAGWTEEGRGGDCCRGARRLLNGTFGISNSGSRGICCCLQLSANAPTLMVSLRDALLSSLAKNESYH